MTLVARWVLVLITVVCLGIDAYVHFDTAYLYDGTTTGTVNQGVLFRIEATSAIVVGLLLIAAFALRRYQQLAAILVVLLAGGGLVLLLLYRYVEVGKIGPIPDMSEPLWYGYKESTAVAQAIATVTGAALFFLARPERSIP